MTETDSGNGDRFNFAGMEYDSVTSQYYDRARYYDPMTGRFESQDPLGFDAGDTDLYRYVYNEPTDAVDPDGLQFTQPSYYPNPRGSTSYDPLRPYTKPKGGQGQGGQGQGQPPGAYNRKNPYHPTLGKNGDALRGEKW